MEPLLPDEDSPLELFETMRRLVGSRDLLERLKTLWVGAQLGERLEWCSDAQIGDLLSKVQERMSLLSPEYSVCEYAKRRLQRSSFKMNKIFGGY